MIPNFAIDKFAQLPVIQRQANCKANAIMYSSVYTMNHNILWKTWCHKLKICYKNVTTKLFLAIGYIVFVALYFVDNSKNFLLTLNMFVGYSRIWWTPRLPRTSWWTCKYTILSITNGFIWSDRNLVIVKGNNKIAKSLLFKNDLKEFSGGKQCEMYIEEKIFHTRVEYNP